MFGVVKNYKNKLFIRFSLFLSVSLLCAFFAANYVEDKQIAENELHVSDSVQLSLTNLTREIEQTLQVYSLGLSNMRSFIYSTKVENLSHSSFKTYTDYIDIQKNYPGARGFGFVRYVEKSDEANFIVSATQDRGDDFEVKSLAENPDSRFIIQYIEPEKNNDLAIGLDIGSEVSRRSAALLSARQNEPVLTMPITLVQENQKKKHGFLLLLPVFGGADQSQEQGEPHNTNKVLGWVYAPLLIGEMLSAIQEKETNLQLHISDATTGREISFFQGEQHHKQYGEMGRDNFTQLNVFGRVWKISAFPNDVFIKTLSLVSPTSIYYQMLSLCMLIALFLSSIFYLIHKHFLSLNQKSELAAVVENGMEGTIGLDKQFCLKYWNDSAKQMFGFDEKSFALPFLDWLISAYSADYLIDIFKRVSQGNAVKNVEVKLNSLDSDMEESKYLNLNFQPIFQDNRFLGVNVSVVDLSEVRSLHEQLEEKNQQLNIKLNRQSDKLKQSASFHDSLLQGADFLIISTDLRGVVTSTNRKLEEILEYSQEDVVGEPITGLLETKYLSSLNTDVFLKFKYVSQNLFDCLIYPLKHQSRVVSESLFEHKDGSHVELQLTASAITDIEGQVLGYLFIADDIRAQKALKFDLELVNSAIHSSEDILLWLNERGAICNSNPFARVALEYSEYELNHLSISDVLPFDSGDSWQAQLESLQTTTSITSEKSVSTRSGAEVPCLITVSKLNINGEIFLFLSAKDISDRLAKERVLEDALDLAAQANLSKDQFLANMGHELRTPLNEVNGSLQLMELTELAPAQIDCLSQAKTSVRELTQAIDDVLDCGEIIRNKLALHTERVDLLEIINSVGQSSSIIAEDKNIEVHFDISEDVPHFVNGDPHRLYQLLMCLMNNAIKFTFEGDVILRCYLVKDTGGQYEIRFQVVDSGVGISEEKQTEIFELFSQAEMGSDRSFGGLGLGLTISKSIVELMSGTIECSSEVGVGTTFSVSIHVDKTQDIEVDDESFKSLPTLKVLIVDDNEISLSVLSKLIDQLGWQVHTAINADEAIKKLHSAVVDNEGFDLALIDWNMPGKSGIDLVKDIRRRFIVEDMPILVMVTAYTRKMLSHIDNRDVENLLSAFLTKPVTRSMLTDLVQSILGAEDLGAASVNSGRLKLDGFRILLVEDNETNQFIAKNLLQSQGAVVSVASEGEEAWHILKDSTESFDIVLMDIQMPGWDGYRATKEIRSDERFNDLPILAMTANVLASDKRKCFEAGMNGHIGKPFELMQLMQEILSLSRKPNVLQVHRSASKKAFDVDKRADSIISAEVITETDSLNSQVLISLQEKAKVDVEESLKRFAGSEELYIQSLNMFTTDLEKYIDTLTGRDNELTFEEIKPIFHTLKGTSGLLGFIELSNLSTECDQLASMLVSKKGNSEPLISLIQVMREIKTAIEQVFEQDNNNEVGLSSEGSVTLPLDQLQILRDQLKHFNMKAVELYATLRQDIAALYPDIAIILSEHITKLEFKEALTLLDDIERLYVESMNG